MDINLEPDDSPIGAPHDYRHALSALNSLPDRCATDLGEVADRIGTDKLELIRWMRTDIKFARLIASKVTT